MRGPVPGRCSAGKPPAENRSTHIVSEVSHQLMARWRQSFSARYQAPAIRIGSPHPAACDHGFSGSGVASQIFTVLSNQALTRRWPSGLNATHPAGHPLRPLRERSSRPVCASHTLTVLSREALTKLLAVGAEGHAVDIIGVPLKGEQLPPGLGIPHLHRVVWRSRGKQFAVRAKHHAPGGPLAVPLEREEFLARLRRPRPSPFDPKNRSPGVCRPG